jgi:hypothetical protein
MPPGPRRTNVIVEAARDTRPDVGVESPKDGPPFMGLRRRSPWSFLASSTQPRPGPFRSLSRSRSMRRRTHTRPGSSGMTPPFGWAASRSTRSSMSTRLGQSWSRPFCSCSKLPSCSAGPRLSQGPAARFRRTGRQPGHCPQHGAEVARACPAHHDRYLRECCRRGGTEHRSPDMVTGPRKRARL